jgi:very-short-patch-repair endonuclease
MKTTPLTYARAKNMRREPTEAEKRLWGGLRNRRLGGLKFHRQVPIGRYIVDFLNREHRLVFEVDGDTHGEGVAIAFDARRTEYLETLGFRVHRVINLEVMRNVDEVLQGIYDAAMGHDGK